MENAKKFHKITYDQNDYYENSWKYIFSHNGTNTTNPLS